MVNDKVIKSMPKVEMVRCEVTGKLYPASECEVVIIKIIKHRDADMNHYNPIEPKERTFVETGKPITVPTVTGPVVDTSSPEYNKIIQTKHSVIPKSMQDLFSPPPGLL